MNTWPVHLIRSFVAYMVSSLFAVSLYVVADGLLFRGTFGGAADGVTYELHYGLGYNSISHILFLTKVVALLGCILAIPVIIFTERRSIKQAKYFAASGFAIGFLFQTGAIWTKMTIISYNVEILKGQIGRISVDLLLAIFFGLGGGLVYWYLAGKHSGRWKEKA